MKKNFIKKLENTLTSRRNELLAKNNKLADIDIEGDDTDVIQGKIIANIFTQLSVRDKERLERVDRALNKIKNGNFGKCEECEELISEKRLEFNPEFSTCISCAEQIEMDARNSKLRGN